MKKFKIFLVIIIPILCFSIVYTKSYLSKVNYEVEKIKKEISSQRKTNESLEMKISELVSLDKIQDIIKKEGLSYNNEVIKNINCVIE